MSRKPQSVWHTSCLHQELGDKSPFRIGVERTVAGAVLGATKRPERAVACGGEGQDVKVMLVDDDVDLSDMIAFILRRHDHEVIQARDGESALQFWRKEKPDFILLDIRLPKMSGWQVCSEIRSESDVPIIMCTVSSDEDDIVRGLDLGADDYVVKPLRPRELIARIRAVQRRARVATANADVGDLLVGQFRLNPRRREVARDKHVVRLTPLEFRVLHELVRHEGQVLRYDILTERAWGYAGIGNSSVLKSHVRHLREKLERDPSRPCHIITIPGAGYTFRVVPEEPEDEVTLHVEQAS